ncbi:MAG: hypothetical protein Q8L86_14725 [Vicinamibacterales bacterium]|nr:hypothetical protein [Vicinamibacterales bacterium]
MTDRRLTTALLVAACAFGIAGCERVKSANPLSPAIAGPIPGVAITAPKPLLPEQNTQIVATEQPLDLLIENAGSSGVRPLWLDLELAVDLEFQSKVHTAERLSPGENGRTTYRMPALLPAETTYFWRVRAADGANTGPYSAVASFRVLEPVILGAPTPLSPIGQITGIQPEFRVQNGSVSGPAGALSYRFEIATAPGASGTVLTATPGGNGITVASAGPLQANTTYFWRVRQSDGQYASPYSPIVEFRTGAPAPPPPTGGGDGGGVGPGGRTANPGPGGKLPLPNMYAVVVQIAAEYPAALANSCQEHGGTWEFMDRLVDRLRTYDTRWGYNWKRGVVGDPSLDVVDYNWGNNPDEGTTEVYIVDVLAGHCGSNPQPAWFDVTGATAAGGAIGRWTGRGRF